MRHIFRERGAGTNAPAWGSRPDPFGITPLHSSKGTPARNRCSCPGKAFWVSGGHYLGHRSSALASSRLAFRIEIEPTAPESRKSAIRCERPSPATVRTVSSPARLRSTILSANALNLDGSPMRSRCIASTCRTSVSPEVSFSCSPTASASSTGMRNRCCGSLRPAPAPSHRAAATSASCLSVWTRNTDMGSLQPVKALLICFDSGVASRHTFGLSIWRTNQGLFRPIMRAHAARPRVPSGPILAWIRRRASAGNQSRADSRRSARSVSASAARASLHISTIF